MSAPYDFRKIKPSVYGCRRPVTGEVVALLHVYFEKRGLELIETKSRALCRNEIHELMITDEKNVLPGGGANRVRAIAFFEVKSPGLIVVGDHVSVNHEKLGSVAGYDQTHMPNHMNILIKSEDLDEPLINVGDQVEFHWI
ncbi:hypothetical protein GF319_12070 [Candidatus Bathyarchaeota archaeon]|jgi:hypothetical protein|nr:hypothetical protein [Candidatus Bathyarchaeota archaeon]